MTADVYQKLLGFLDDEDRFTRAELTEALLAVVRDHEPDHRHAGIGFNRDNADTCAYCHFGEPVAVFKDYLNGSRRKVTMHCHGLCDWCGNPDCEHKEYPCSTVKAICEALGGAA